MRIQHIITRMIPGGAQENTLDSCVGLLERGYQVQLVTGLLHGQGDVGPELMHAARRAGVDMVLVPELVRDVHPYKDFVALFKLCRAIRGFRPDVVHTHSSKAGILGRLAARITGAPAVHTIHGLPFHRFQPRVVSRLFRALEQRAAPWTQRLVTVCDLVRDDAVAAGIAPAEKFTTVYSGFDVDRFLCPPEPPEIVRGRLGLPVGGRVVGTIGRLVPLKGHELLLDAFARVSRHMDGVFLVVVGEGMLLAGLKARARAVGIGDRVVFTGRVPVSEIPSLVAACDVIAQPSLREGLSRALPQALIAGVPVVAFDLDGAAEIIEDGVTGHLVPPLDIAAFRARLTALLKDRRLRESMGARGRERFADRFRKETMVRRLEDVYRSVTALPG